MAKSLSGASHGRTNPMAIVWANEKTTPASKAPIIDRLIAATSPTNAPRINNSAQELKNVITDGEKIPQSGIVNEAPVSTAPYRVWSSPATTKAIKLAAQATA